MDIPETPAEIVEADAIVARAKTAISEAMQLFRKHCDSALAMFVMERVLSIQGELRSQIQQLSSEEVDENTRAILAIAGGTLGDARAIPDLRSLVKTNFKGWGALAAHKLANFPDRPLGLKQDIEERLASGGLTQDQADSYRDVLAMLK